jgi:uncharacterized repeat protein (TIGR02543 family)
MSDAYSGKVTGSGLSYGGIRTYVGATVSSSGATSTVTANGNMQSIAISGYKWSASLTCNGASLSTGSGSTDGGSDWTYEWAPGSFTKSFARGHSAYTVPVRCEATISGGTAVAAVSATIPALPSYKLTYNANGGSGAPSAQTIWYGETTTISATRPTRANYTFLGWAKTSSATTAAYAPGKAYSLGDAAVTLYAVWKLAYKSPSVSVSAARRVDSTTTETYDPDSTHAYVAFAWSVDTTTVSGNLGKTATATCTVGGTTATATLSGFSTTASSGTVVARVEAATTAVAKVTLTVTDTHGGSASATGTVGTASYPLDIANSGRSVAICSTAGAADTIRLGQLTLMNVQSTVGSMTTFRLNATCQDRVLRGGKSVQWPKSLACATKTKGTYASVSVHEGGSGTNPTLRNSSWSPFVVTDGCAYATVAGMYLATCSLTFEGLTDGDHIRLCVTAGPATTGSNVVITPHVVIYDGRNYTASFSFPIWYTDSNVSAKARFYFNAMNETAGRGTVRFRDPVITLLG